MTEDIYNSELLKVKDYFNNKVDDLYPQRSLYYIFGCVHAYYMYDKLKKDPSLLIQYLRHTLSLIDVNYKVFLIH